MLYRFRLPLGHNLLIKHFPVPFGLVRDLGHEIQHAPLSHRDSQTGHKVSNGMGESLALRRVLVPCREVLQTQTEARQLDTPVVGESAGFGHSIGRLGWFVGTEGDEGHVGIETKERKEN